MRLTDRLKVRISLSLYYNTQMNNVIFISDCEVSPKVLAHFEGFNPVNFFPFTDMTMTEYVKRFFVIAFNASYMLTK
ncbi:hypothetical protein BCL69_101159 [Nitrosomonas communis]|uniref:Uncharacterized protein n=1 Tax=Nitrosomonas communis TaxID=44574 RepID=A0A0F7KG55_9PROT|nr:hypothetical protein AAW31_10805 [Nitrosomonas communis]TYP91153.1 hypothetical protein BCL69_101159 [Nitrosomonas communis]